MGKPLSSLTLRLISSAILIPVVVGIIVIGGWWFAGFAALCLIIALYEWIRLTPSILMKIIGVFYLGFSLFEIILLRNEIFADHFNYLEPFQGTGFGVWYIMLFLAAIWASDSTAYLFGKMIGGKKMSPTISPNKTWSGYVGALIGPVIILALEQSAHPLEEFDPMNVSYSRAVLFGVLLGITGQAGDLMISAMKRKIGVKDTGAIIPGHGGILDRIDALLLALPVFLAYVKLATE